MVEGQREDLGGCSCAGGPGCRAVGGRVGGGWSGGRVDGGVGGACGRRGSRGLWEEGRRVDLGVDGAWVEAGEPEGRRGAG